MTSRSPGRPRDPAADEAIIAAAAELLIERGVGGAGIEQIAQRAKVAKVTVYRRWKSKHELLARAVESLREEIPDVESTRRSPSELPASIEELLPQWAQLLTDPRFRDLTARLVGAGPDHPELLRAYWDHHVLPRKQRSTALLRSAMAAGVLPADADPDMLADMMTGAILNLLLLRPNPADGDEVLDYLRRMFHQVGLLRT